MMKRLLVIYVVFIVFGAPELCFAHDADTQDAGEVISFANNVGHIDAVVDICGLDKAKWLPMRSEAIKLLNLLSETEKLTPAISELDVDAAANRLRQAHIVNSEIPQCSSKPKELLLEKQLVNAREWISWASNQVDLNQRR